MSWGAVIAGGVALAGGVASSAMSSSASKKAAASANAASEASTEFAKQQYEDWKAVYGPVQTNLSSYYSNLTPDYFATVGLENFEKERTAALENLDVQLAQRGVTDSGVAIQLKSQERLNAAQQRASIRRDAQNQVANAQLNFLASGSNAAVNNLQSTLNNNTNSARAIATQAAQANSKTMQSATTALGSLLQTGLSAYFDDGTAKK
ncbi:hypothetical protein [Dickeya phage Amaethon]|nr:hypothetical protein [Dickeya phage Amaethon]